MYHERKDIAFSYILYIYILYLYKGMLYMNHQREWLD